MSVVSEEATRTTAASSSLGTGHPEVSEASTTVKTSVMDGLFGVFFKT